MKKISFDEVIGLVTDTPTFDKEGFKISNFTEREIFAGIKSVGRSEFYSAEQVGMTATVIFVINFEDYNKEQKIRHNDFFYKVIRDYKAEEEVIELTCERVE